MVFYFETYDTYSFFDGLLLELRFWRYKFSFEISWYDPEDGGGLIIYYPGGYLMRSWNNPHG